MTQRSFHADKKSMSGSVVSNRITQARPIPLVPMTFSVFCLLFVAEIQAITTLVPRFDTPVLTFHYAHIRLEESAGSSTPPTAWHHLMNPNHLAFPSVLSAERLKRSTRTGGTPTHLKLQATSHTEDPNHLSSKRQALNLPIAAWAGVSS